MRQSLPMRLKTDKQTVNYRLDLAYFVLSECLLKQRHDRVSDSWELRLRVTVVVLKQKIETFNTTHITLCEWRFHLSNISTTIKPQSRWRSIQWLSGTDTTSVHPSVVYLEHTTFRIIFFNIAMKRLRKGFFGQKFNSTSGTFICWPIWKCLSVRPSRATDLLEVGKS